MAGYSGSGYDATGMNQGAMIGPQQGVSGMQVSCVCVRVGRWGVAVCGKEVQGHCKGGEGVGGIKECLR